MPNPIVTEDKLEHPWKIPEPIDVILDGILILVIDAPLNK
jgi:hypothetical protein